MVLVLSFLGPAKNKNIYGIVHIRSISCNFALLFKKKFQHLGQIWTAQCINSCGVIRIHYQDNVIS